MATGDVRRAVATQMADAARDWLDALDDGQRQRAAWPFPADDERRVWFYTPTDHGGLPLGEMGAGQQRAAMRLLRSGLSEAAYVTATTVIGLENVLDAVEKWRSTFDRERGRDPGMYYARVFGEPADTATWGWRFGGHHVSVNHTIIDGELASSTPCFLGADPAHSPLLGPHVLRPLAGAEDLGRELVRSLDAGQLDRALVAPVAPVDIVSANRSRAAPGDRPLPLQAIFRRDLTGVLLDQMSRGQAAMEQAIGLRAEHIDALSLSAEPKGVPAAELSRPQRELLRQLLDVYVRRVPDELADAESAKYAAEGDLDALAFAWAGGLEPGEPHYYRIQGARLLAEYDNTQRGVNHVHTVWRDLDADFGGDALADHYATAHH
jgi:Protein of unknown function (DUF3500)